MSSKESFDELDVVAAVYGSLRKVPSEHHRKNIVKYVLDRIRHEEDEKHGLV